MAGGSPEPPATFDAGDSEYDDADDDDEDADDDDEGGVDSSDGQQRKAYVPLTRAERLQRLVAGVPVRNRSRHTLKEKRPGDMDDRLSRLVAGLPVRNRTSSRGYGGRRQQDNINAEKPQRRIKAYSPKFTKLTRRRRLDKIYR